MPNYPRFENKIPEGRCNTGRNYCCGLRRKDGRGKQNRKNRGVLDTASRSGPVVSWSLPNHACNRPLGLIPFPRPQ
jgi:hypothetical protein